MSYLSEVLADSPNAYFRMDDVSGVTCVATVGTDLTYENTPTLGVAGALTAGGDSDTAVSFASASSQDALLPGPQGWASVGDVFTFEVWVKRASIGVAASILFNGGGAADIYFTAGNLVHLDQAATASIVSSDIAITDTTTWHHIVVTKNGATVKIYIDGADHTGSVTNSTFSNNTDFQIAHGNQGFFDGAIDEVALYPTALSAARVLVHYNAATQAPTAAPQRLQPRRGGTGRW